MEREMQSRVPGAGTVGSQSHRRRLCRCRSPPHPAAACLDCRRRALARRHGGQDHHSRCCFPRLHRLPHRPAHADPGCAVSCASGAGQGEGSSPRMPWQMAAASCSSEAFDCAHFNSSLPIRTVSPATGTVSTLSVRRATSQAPTASASAATAPCCWVRCWGAAGCCRAMAAEYHQAVHPPLLTASAKPATCTPATPATPPSADYSKREDLKWAADCWWDRDVIVYGDAGAAGCLSGGWLGQCCCLCTCVLVVLLSRGAGVLLLPALPFCQGHSLRLRLAVTVAMPFGFALLVLQA